MLVAARAGTEVAARARARQKRTSFLITFLLVRKSWFVAMGKNYPQAYRNNLKVINSF
jgi:hypothetical protein